VKRTADKLLVVDDDANNRDMLSRRLIRRGYEVDVAEDGQAALDKVLRENYDLVLLDQMMPGMSGLDVLRLLRGTYSQSDLPVIMVTAIDQSQAVVEALDHGANDYVVKPVDMPIVVARIQSQLARSRADRLLKVSDPLTGLSNRVLLLARLAESAGQSQASSSMALLLLNLDGFKTINDSFGHSVGDQILVNVAGRFRGVVAEAGITAEESLVARIGGDEFVILVERALGENQPARLADSLLACLAEPVLWNGVRVPVSASIGVMVSRDPGSTPEELLRDADLAMYRAKELGKHCWQVFEPALRARAQARVSMAIDMRHAVERGELLTVYQPKIDLATRRITGFEALLRWQHPQRGMVYPVDFIPVAEETGLIIPLGGWILRTACLQLREWQEQFPVHPPLSMNVNLSVKQLLDPSIVDLVRAVLEETGVPPKTLKLELTESCVMSGVGHATEILSQLQAMGVGLKLDDFGTGYSSLSYLKALHFDSLKIDRSFISKLGEDAESHAIVETIVELAHTLHMSVVAEGIESEQQLHALTGMGCDTGQGFYFSEPVRGDAAERLLESMYGVKQPLPVA
jgi:diguanylate cyclase (GGDEF)-like protein